MGALSTPPPATFPGGRASAAAPAPARVRTCAPGARRQGSAGTRGAAELAASFVASLATRAYLSCLLPVPGTQCGKGMLFLKGVSGLGFHLALQFGGLGPSSSGLWDCG